MKRFLLVALIGLGLMGMAIAANAFTDRVNTCTSVFQLTGQNSVASGSDTAIVRILGNPSIFVTKDAFNYRTSISDPNIVNARSGDSVMFTIQWWNQGEATADTVVLTDYVPGQA